MKDTNIAVEKQHSVSLFWLLVQATVATKPHLGMIAEESALTPPQMFTLCKLEPDQPVPMHAVSTGLHCDASNLTGIVDRLVASGYVRRQELPQDRRVKALVLTDKGVHMRHNLLQAAAAVHLPGELALSKAELATLKKLLAKLLAS